MTPGDRRRRLRLRHIQLRGRLRRLDRESEALRDALVTAKRGSGAYREQQVGDLTARLNGILRERHTVAAQTTSCERELAGYAP